MIGLLFGAKRLEHKLDSINAKLDTILKAIKKNPHTEALKIHNNVSKWDSVSRLLRRK